MGKRFYAVPKHGAVVHASSVPCKKAKKAVLRVWRLSYAYEGRTQTALAGLWLWFAFGYLVCSMFAAGAILLAHCYQREHLVGFLGG